MADRQTNDPPTDDVQKSSLPARAKTLATALRGWIAGHQLAAFAAGGISCALLLGSFGLWLIVAPNSDADTPRATLDNALRALDNGAYAEAEAEAIRLRDAGNLQPEKLGGPAFVLGAVTLIDAEIRWAKNKNAAFLLAARHLEEARDRGFPPGRKADGLFYLGKSLCLSGRYSESQAPLKEALAARSPRKNEIHRLLSIAYLNEATPNPSEALRFNELYLAEPALKQEQRLHGMLQRSRILLALDRPAECRKTLDELPQIAQNRPDIGLVRGRLLISEARTLKAKADSDTGGELQAAALEKYRLAIQTFRAAQGRDTLDNRVTRASMLLVGLCLAEMGPPYHSQALDQLTRTGKLYADTPESLAALLLQADLLRERHEHARAVEAYKKALAAAGTPDTYASPWVSLPELRIRILAAFEHYNTSEQFDRTLNLLDSFPPLFTQVDTLKLRAETWQLRAESVWNSAENLPEDQARLARRLAASHFRKSGYTYLQLAKSRRATRDYPEDVLHSGENLLRGWEYAVAANVLTEYLRNESRARRPQALLGLGRAYLALNKLDESVRAFLNCIESYPRDASTYQARIWCSKAYQEKGTVAKAEKMLLDNLADDTLVPRKSAEWRRSLFDLGQLLYVDGRYEQAIEKLDEAVARYPDSPEAVDGLYTLADAHRLAAQEPRKQLLEERIESIRVARHRKAEQLLSAAQKHYASVQKALIAQSEEKDLSEHEQALLRNCYMLRGAVLMDLGRFEEAIAEYDTAAGRYQDQPIVLEIYMQLAYCYSRLGQPGEARGNLERAKVALSRLSPDADYTSTTNFSRDQWNNILDQLTG